MALADVFYRFIKFIIFVLIVALTISVGVGVIFRYVFQNTLYWANELPIFFFMWITMLGAAVAYRENTHMRVSFLVDKLPPEVRRTVAITGLAIIAAFFVFLVVTGIQVCIANMDSESEAMKVPYGLVYLCIPIASALMLSSSLGQLRDALRSRGEGGAA